MNRVIPALVACLLAALPASAAEPVRSLELMSVAPQAVIYVRTTSGAEIQGRFVRSSSQVLVLSVADGSELTLPADEVSRVWRRGDGLRNGAIVGGAFGLAGAIFGQSQCTDCSSEIAIGIALGVPLWAGIGALVDRVHVGRTLIYLAP